MKSPNAAGRPPVDYVLRKAFDDIGPEAKEVLTAYMRGDAKALGLPEGKSVQQDLRLRAALEVLDRWLGKPKQMDKSPASPLDGKTTEEQLAMLGEAVKPYGLHLVNDKDGE
jgi:hypothetical protein